MKTNPHQNIPNGWKILTFKDLGLSVIDGDRGVNYPKQDDFSKLGYCLFLNAGNVTRSGFKFSETSFITERKDKEMGKGKLNKDDLVITTRGTIGNVAHYSEQIPYENIRINSGMAIIRNSKEKINTNFLLQYFNSSLFNKELKRVSFGSAQPQLTIQIINKFEVKTPEDKFEQVRILSVLETWDLAIEKLERKIEVKKEVKKGLMQELLTGKTRLHGFKDEWHTIRLGEVSTLTKGKDLSKDDLDPNGKYEAIHYGELFTKYNEQIEFVRSRTNKYENPFLSKEGDVLMPTSDVTPRGLSTASCITKSGVILGGDILVVRPNIKRLDGSFFSFFVSSHKKHVMRLVSGTTVFHLYGSDLAKLNLSLPSVEEQKKITKILIAANKDIEKLEQKLSILKDQKKYLLSNLVTGAIRTPESLSIPQ